MVTPPGGDAMTQSDRARPPAHLAGVEEVYRVGEPRSIAALA